MGVIFDTDEERGLIHKMFDILGFIDYQYFYIAFYVIHLSTVRKSTHAACCIACLDSILLNQPFKVVRTRDKYAFMFGLKPQK